MRGSKTVQLLVHLSPLVVGAQEIQRPLKAREASIQLSKCTLLRLLVSKANLVKYAPAPQHQSEKQQCYRNAKTQGELDLSHRTHPRRLGCYSPFTLESGPGSIKAPT